MSFAVTFRDRSRRGEEAEALITSGKPWLCQDWCCPAKVSCAKHWGRSRQYAAMADYRGALLEPMREAGADSCDHYARDKPRAWMLSGPNQCLPALAPAVGIRR